VSELGIKCFSTLCQGLASSAAINCVRAWHQLLQYTVLVLDIICSYAVNAHPSDKSLKRSNNDADEHNNNENNPEKKEGE